MDTPLLGGPTPSELFDADTAQRLVGELFAVLNTALPNVSHRLGLSRVAKRDPVTDETTVGDMVEIWTLTETGAHRVLVDADYADSLADALHTHARQARTGIVAVSAAGVEHNGSKR